jgi:hypothetical protein
VSDKTEPVDISVEPVLLDKEATAQLLGGISVFKLDQLMKAGEIEAKVIGKRVVFDLDEVRRFAKELPSWEPKDPRFLLSATR